MGVPVYGPGILLGHLESNRFDVIDWERDGNKDIIIGTFQGEFKVGDCSRLTSLLTRPAHISLISNNYALLLILGALNQYG